MITEYLLNIYMNYLKNIFLNKDKKKIQETWEKIKLNNKILEYAIKVDKYSFKSNIITEKILKDVDLYNTKVYNELVDIIYSNRQIASIKVNKTTNTTFMMVSLTNENLKLTSIQKEFLILEAENSLYSQKFYKNNKNITDNQHGYGLYDLRLLILYNNSFSLTEKANLIERFYPDDEIKHSILKEIEWSIIKKLNLKEYNNNFDEIYELDFNDIPFNIVKKIELCKYIKSILPESIIKKYINNE